jgi:hypothetical protein
MDEQKLLNKLNCYYGKKLNQELPQIILTAVDACFLHAVVSVSIVRGVPNYFKSLEEKVAKLEGWLKYLWKEYADGYYTGYPKELQEISDYIKAMEGR